MSAAIGRVFKLTVSRPSRLTMSFRLSPAETSAGTKKDFGGCDRIEDIPSNIKDYHRMKGLGELANEQVEYYLVNPKTRNFYKLIIQVM